MAAAQYPTALTDTKQGLLRCERAFPEESAVRFVSFGVTVLAVRIMLSVYLSANSRAVIRSLHYSNGKDYQV